MPPGGVDKALRRDGVEKWRLGPRHHGGGEEAGRQGAAALERPTPTEDRSRRGLAATGRRAKCSALNLEAVGVKYDDGRG